MIASKNEGLTTSESAKRVVQNLAELDSDEDEKRVEHTTKLGIERVWISLVTQSEVLPVTKG